MLSITAWPTKQPLKQHAGSTLQHWHAPGTQQQQKPLKNEQPVTVLPGEGSGGSSESAWVHETGGVDVAAGAPFLRRAAHHPRPLLGLVPLDAKLLVEHLLNRGDDGHGSSIEARVDARLQAIHAVLHEQVRLVPVIEAVRVVDVVEGPADERGAEVQRRDTAG